MADHTHKNRLTLAAHLGRSVGAAPHLIADDVEALSRFGSQANGLGCRLCNGVIDQGQYDKQKDNLRAKVKEVCDRYGLTFSLGGDPRGYCLKLRGAGLRGNTWGGDAEGFGID